MRRINQRGFEADPSHFYSGTNALAMITMLTELAAALPNVWNERFADEEEALFKLREYKLLRTSLTGAIDFALRSAQQKLQREDRQDPWVTVGLAEHAFLCGKPNAPTLYREALKPLGPFAAGSVGRQFQIFRKLKLLERVTAAAAPVFDVTVRATGEAKLVRVLLFTGHRIDSPERSSPRFPAALENEAREAIRNAIQREISMGDDHVIALSGGASGGDLLFLESCEDLQIESHIYLIAPRNEYVAASVAPAGPEWILRFDRQLKCAKNVREYQRTADLPNWLGDRPETLVWGRSNRWMIYNALALGGTRTSLIALRDGRGGEGHYWTH